MIPELGQLALILALLLALLQGTLCLAGAARNDAAWVAMGRGAALGQFLFIGAGFLILAWSFLANDFSVMNVAQHSSRRLPPVYRLTATWGSHEGSMLLWALILGGWTVAVSLLSRSLPMEVKARVMGVMGLVSVGFLTFILFTSNPFLRLDPPPPDGSDLNPLLQDPGMIIHPPLLYMGYVGFSVAFAFALAALISGRLDAAWARWSRPWTLVAWLFLTMGIAVGSWWAYYELGWGGWWFWDPTENASLMPWLLGTALIHSLAVTDKRGALRVWTVFLAIGAFSLSLLGTFLVRSGVLSSIHAFAQDPLRGLFILAFLLLVIGGSLALFAWRAPRVATLGSFELISRESLMLVGVVLVLVSAATVLLGTLYPLLLDALDMGKISVGPPYFNTVFVPVMAPVLLLAGIAPLMRWRHTTLQELLGRIRWMLPAAMAIGLLLPTLVQHFDWRASLGTGLASWLLLASLGAYAARRRTGTPTRALLGMCLAHGGLAIGVAAMGLISAYETEKAVAMKPGDTATLAAYTFTFKGVTAAEGPNYSAARGAIEVTKDGHPVALLAPEKRVYSASRMPMTESAIHYGFTGDIYVALGEPLAAPAWAVRLYHKPFAGWLWAGALLMASGGLLAASDRRYRNTDT